MNNRVGFFVALEGIDNAGKTSLLDFIRAEFSPQLPVVTTQELDTPVGAVIRRQLTDSGLSSIEKILLFAADRQARLCAGFAAALGAKSLCVADRWTFSAAAYRLAEDPNLLDYVLRVNAVFPSPDLTILIDLPAEVSILRGEPLNKNNYELEYLSRVRDQYLSLAAQFGFLVVDGTQGFTSMAAEISLSIRDRLGAR